MRPIVPNSLLLLLFISIISSSLLGERRALADVSNNNECRRDAESGRHREFRFVQVVWRHGDRAPKRRPYPSDVYGVKKWPRGWSHLTNLGMQHMKELGEFMRYRYRHFAGGDYSKFNETEVFLLSSESSRAIVSAQALFNGLYPPRNRTDGFDDHFDEGLDWQPLPVHSIGYGIPDPLLKPSSFNCPTYKRLYDPIKRRVAAELETHFGDIFVYVSAKINGGKRLPYCEVVQLNNINREIAHGLEPQPNWAVRKRWPNYRNETTLQVVTRMARIHRAAQFNKSTLAYLRGGFLLGNWLQRAMALLRNESTSDLLVNGSVDMKDFLHFGKRRKWSLPTRLSLNSAHDSTLMSLLYALNVTSENGELVIRYNKSREISDYSSNVRNTNDSNLNNNTNNNNKYDSFSKADDNVVLIDKNNTKNNNNIYFADNMLWYSGGESRESSVESSDEINDTVDFVDSNPDINATRNGQSVETAVGDDDDDDTGMSNFDESWRLRVDDSDGLVIPPASCVFMEVYRDCDALPGGLLTVELYVRRLKFLKRIAIPDCGEPCPLATFVAMFRHRAIFKEKNVYKKCKADYYKQSTSSPKK